jgi:hypothetical protein
LEEGGLELVADPVSGELVASSELEPTVGEVVELDTGEPSIEGSVRSFTNLGDGGFPYLAVEFLCHNFPVIYAGCRHTAKFSHRFSTGQGSLALQVIHRVVGKRWESR